MATDTKYRHLTDKELLNHIDEARSKSPLIEELAQRLEREMDKSKSATWTHDCPVCEAPLNCFIEDEGEILTLEAA
jgi:predicted Ser/Thr protein kinase